MPINYRKTYDKLNYDEQIKFRDLSIKCMQEIYPHYIIRPLEPQIPDGVFITNKQDNVRIQFPLHDLYARFSTTGGTKIELKEIILDHYSSMLKMAEDASVIRDDSKLEWDDVRNFVRPRLTRSEELHDLDQYVHLPFGEDVVTAFVIDDRPDENLVTWVNNRMLEKWNIEKDDFIKKAFENFQQMMDGLQFHGIEPPRGYLRTNSSLETASTAILIGGLRHFVAQNVGSPFRFGIPSRYVFFSWAELDDEEFQIEMKAMMEREFERLPSKLTSKIYEVDEQGQIKQLKNQPEVPKKTNFNN